MTFKVGDTVVYPHHGAARIEEIETRSIKGEDKTYLVLKVDKGDLTVRVPADNAELVGVRDVVGQEGLERVEGVDADAGRERRGEHHPAHRRVPEPVVDRRVEDRPSRPQRVLRGLRGEA